MAYIACRNCGRGNPPDYESCWGCKAPFPVKVIPEPEPLDGDKVATSVAALIVCYRLLAKRVHGGGIHTDAEAHAVEAVEAALVAQESLDTAPDPDAA